MVRNYIKKRAPASYSEAHIQQALADIKTYGMSVRAAARKFNIPYLMLYCRQIGTRGQKRIRRGRLPVLPQKHEESLANG